MSLDMKNLIVDRLGNIKNTEEKEALKTVLEEVFLPLYDTVIGKYEALESRIYDEIPFHPAAYTIRSTLLTREQVNNFTWLFPMVKADADSASTTWEMIQQQLAQNDEAILDTIFLEADYLACREVESSGQYYSASLFVGGQTIPVRVKLRLATRYQDKIEELYTHFQANGIPWVTPNIAYCHKLFDIVVTKIETGYEIKKDETVTIGFDLQGLGVYKRDLVPVWNVDNHAVDETLFPVPAQDKVNYEYKYLLPDTMEHDGYLVNLDAPQLISMRREPHALIAVSPSRSDFQWTFIQIHQREPSATEQFDYPVLSNKQHDSFAARMLSSYGNRIKTQGELIRLICSFEAAESLEYDSFFISNQTVKGETYDNNLFLRDEMRDRQEMKTMVLRFKAKKKGDVLNRDTLSFIVSQIQLVFPEYNCVGALL